MAGRKRQTVSSNSNLTQAKRAKNDEFYTQYHDIEKEMNAYLEFDENVFRGKTILLPCDDPEWSNFTKYFAVNFNRYGIKKLISTSFAPNSKPYQASYQPSLFEADSPRFDAEKTKAHGKIFILDRDVNGDGKIDFDDIEWDYLQKAIAFIENNIKGGETLQDFNITHRIVKQLPDEDG